MTNKQLNLLAEVILDNVNAHYKEVKNSEEFKNRVKEELDGSKELDLISRLREVEDKISDLKSEQKHLQSLISSAIPGAYKFARSQKFMESLESRISKELEDEFGIERISKRDVEKEIMIHQSNDASELIEAITEKLTN